LGVVFEEALSQGCDFGGRVASIFAGDGVEGDLFFGESVVDDFVRGSAAGAGVDELDVGPVPGIGLEQLGEPLHEAAFTCGQAAGVFNDLAQKTDEGGSIGVAQSRPVRHGAAPV